MAGRCRYDPQFGARPVKRVIQRTLLNDLSKQILAEEVSKDSRIMVDVKMIRSFSKINKDS